MVAPLHHAHAGTTSGGQTRKGVKGLCTARAPEPWREDARDQDRCLAAQRLALAQLPAS